MTFKPLLALSALTLCGTLAFAQQTPPPASASAPAPPAAPVERRQPARPGMRPGMMQQHKGQGSFRPSGMMRGKGHGDFHGSQRGGMGAGFHIVPPGMWWKSPEVVQRLTLTPEQTKKMDDIFQQSRIQLIDLKANVEKQDVMLEPMLAANPPDTTKTMAQIDKVAQARADLEKANARMLLGIRGVLTPDQWTKLSARGGPAPGPQGPGGPGGGGRGRGPGGPGSAGGEDFIVSEPIE